MAEFGADVACCDTIEERARETVALISKFGYRSIAITADISKQDEIKTMMTKPQQNWVL